MAKTYTIGEAAKMFNLSVATIRYYDQQGLLPNLKRVSGIRQFNKDNLDTLQTIECLKMAGMSLKEIYQYLQWYQEGDKTLQQRLELFQHLREQIMGQIKDLETTLKVAEYKCKYYEQAIEDGTEKYVAQNKTYLMDIVNNDQ